MRYSVCMGAVLFVMFHSGCGAVMSSDEWNHFAFSASFSSVAAAATSRPAESIGISFGIGLLKEIYDQVHGSGFQSGDLCADLAGSVLGGVAAEICMEEFP